MFLLCIALLFSKQFTQIHFYQPCIYNLYLHHLIVDIHDIDLQVNNNSRYMIILYNIVIYRIMQLFKQNIDLHIITSQI